MTGIQVTAMPMMAPGCGRAHYVASEGATVAEIVALALPGIGKAGLTRVRVTLTTPNGSDVVRRRHWERVKPKAGVHVVVRLVPGKDALRSALLILVSVASAGIASFLVGPAVLGLGASAGLVKGLITFGLTALGGMLVNALFKPDPEKPERPTYSISGWRNEYRPDQPIPDVMGHIRYAPPFAASSWTDVVGDNLYAVACVDWGYGPLEIEDLRLGETSIDDYDEVQYETRQGYADDAPLTLYRSQVIETPVGAALTHPVPRDDSGEMIEGAPFEDKPVRRTTARDVTGFGYLLSFPTGLIWIDKKGKERWTYVDITVRWRQVGTTDWLGTNIQIHAKKKAGFFRLGRHDFPIRGTYEVELEMRTGEFRGGNNEQYFNRCDWVALQAYRPEYPFPWDVPTAKTALRIKATDQINGQVDNINAMVRRIAPDFDSDAGEWVTFKPRNPSALALRVLQSTLNFEPTEDDEIDWDAFESWHTFCRLKNLTYDRVHDFSASRDDVLKAIGAAGRAAVFHDGTRWTVVVDQPGKAVVEHLNPRNSWDFGWSTEYFDPPDGVRVTFLDETNDYKQATRIIPWPGFVGTPQFTEVMDMPGVTNPDMVWIEARRRMYEMLYRATAYSATQSGTARAATVGDHVKLSRDIMVDALHSARVRKVREPEDGNPSVELDDHVVMLSGETYALQWIEVNEVDGHAVSIGRTRVVQTIPGKRKVLRFNATGILPREGDLVHFGPASQVSHDAIVVKIERGTDDSSVITMMPEAAIIDQLTDAEVPPEWNGRVGNDIGPVFTAPAVPRVTGVRVGITETDIEDGFIILLEPGSGAIPLSGYEVRHRLTTLLPWLGPVTGTVAAGAVLLTGIYNPGDTVEFQARAISGAGTPSDWGPIVERQIPDGEVLPFPAPADFVVVGGSRDPGSGPVAVLLASWELLDDEDLTFELWWADAGTGFADPRKVLLPAGTTDHEIFGVTEGELYDVQVRAYDPASTEVGEWAKALNVLAIMPVVLGVGDDMVIGIGDGMVLSLNGRPRVMGIGGGMLPGIGDSNVLRI